MGEELGYMNSFSNAFLQAESVGTDECVLPQSVLPQCVLPQWPAEMLRASTSGAFSHGSSHTMTPLTNWDEDISNTNLLNLGDIPAIDFDPWQLPGYAPPQLEATASTPTQYDASDASSALNASDFYVPSEELDAETALLFDLVSSATELPTDFLALPPLPPLPPLPIDEPRACEFRRGPPFMSSATDFPTDFLTLPPLPSLPPLPPLPPLPIDPPRTYAPRRGLPESFAFQPTFASPSFETFQEPMLAFSRAYEEAETPSSYSSSSTSFSSGSSSRTPDDIQGGETSFASFEQVYPSLVPDHASRFLPEIFLPPTSDVDVSGLFQPDVAAQHVPPFSTSAAMRFPKQPFGDYYHNLPRDTVAPAAVHDKKRKRTAKANGKGTAKSTAKSTAKKAPVHASSSTSPVVSMAQHPNPFQDSLPTCADAAKYTRANAPAMSSSAPYKIVEYCDFLVRTGHGTLVRCGHVLSTDRDDVKAHFNKHKRSFDQGADIPCPYCFGAMKRYSNICRHIEDSHTILNKPKCPTCKVPITRNDDFYRTRHLRCKEHKEAVKALAEEAKKVSGTASNSLPDDNLDGGDLDDGDLDDGDLEDGDFEDDDLEDLRSTKRTRH